MRLKGSVGEEGKNAPSYEHTRIDQEKGEKRALLNSQLRNKTFSEPEIEMDDDVVLFWNVIAKTTKT